MSDPVPTSGRTSADDPGLLRSMGSGTPLGQMRSVGVVFSGVPVLIGALLPLILDESDSGLRPGVGVGVVVAVAVLSALVQAVTVPRQFAPPAAAATQQGGGGDAGGGRSPADLAREGVFQLRAALFLRLALSETAVLVGFLMSFATASALPYAVGFALGWPMMLLAVPTAGQVERARDRMQADGAPPVPLWDALLTRA
jgi:hypothetical protein